MSPTLLPHKPPDTNARQRCIHQSMHMGIPSTATRSLSHSRTYHRSLAHLLTTGFLPRIVISFILPIHFSFSSNSPLQPPPPPRLRAIRSSALLCLLSCDQFARSTRLRSGGAMARVRSAYTERLASKRCLQIFFCYIKGLYRNRRRQAAPHSDRRTG